MILVIRPRLGPSLEALFASVAEHASVLGVEFRERVSGYFAHGTTWLEDGSFPIARVDLPRGYKRLMPGSLRRLIATPSVAKRLRGQAIDGVFFSMPHQAPLVAMFRDVPTFYIAIDNYDYYGWGDRFVRAREGAMCRSVDTVLCVSTALRDRLIKLYGCDPARCRVLPNAAANDSAPEAPLHRPAPATDPLARLPGPRAGVIGVCDADRIDVALVEDVVERTPWLSWSFLGTVVDTGDRFAGLRSRTHQVQFTGYQPYETLYECGRSLDVAIMPYASNSLSAYGSPVRLFEHIAATRPILATSAYPQVLEYRDLLTVADTADDMVRALETLREQDFDDGRCRLRWEAARQHTWRARARDLMKLLAEQRAATARTA